MSISKVKQQILQTECLISKVHRYQLQGNHGQRRAALLRECFNAQGKPCNRCRSAKKISLFWWFWCRTIRVYPASDSRCQQKKVPINVQWWQVPIWTQSPYTVNDRQVKSKRMFFFFLIRFLHPPSFFK